MNVVLAIYQSRVPSGFRWTTVGLSSYTRRRDGKSPTKLQRKLVDEVRNLIGGAPAEDLCLFRMPLSLKLERVRLELSLRGTQGHRRASGVFPLLTETRWRTSSESMVIARHPERQEEWFPVRDDQPLEEQAAIFFAQAWAELDDDEIAALRSDRKDCLRVVSFTARPKSLLERVGKKKSVWDDLEATRGAPPKKKGRYRVLDKLGISLTQQAIEGTLEGGMRRAPYWEQLELLLGGERKTPTLLVGPPGVGKRTLLRRWVADRLEADGWVLHRNLDEIHEAWSISGKRIIAGMSYVGDWEQRCLELLEDAREKNRVLLVEDLHAFGRIGRSRESDANLALFFQGPLARGEIAIAGACTSEQLQRLETEAPSFAALFTVLPVPPTTADETMRMVVHEARKLEARYQTVFDPPIFPLLLEQAGALWGASAFPGKALALLRQLASDYEKSLVTYDEVMSQIGSETGLPDFVIDRSYVVVPATVEKDLASRVMGQPEAVSACRDLMLKIRSGLTDPRRPWGAMLFAGPTGTGKTEMAKALAAALYGEEARLLRFDMSEYQGPDAAARLCGDAWDPEGALVRAVRSQPFCVVLLDEIEKAHPSALHLLLQLLDDGRLSDAAGDTADFTHAVVVMTSNLGARVREAVGFGEDGVAEARLDSDRAVRDFFPPELFNRIDRIVHFRPLDREVAEKVAQKELARLLARPGLSSRNVFVTVADEVRSFAVDQAFDKRMGARSIKRWLEEEVGGRLAEALVHGPAAPMRRAQVWIEGGRMLVESQALVAREPSRGLLALEPLLKAPAPELVLKLRQASEALFALSHGAAQDRLVERMRFHVARHATGDQAHAEPAYALDAVRQRVTELLGKADSLLGASKEAAQDVLEADLFGTLERSSPTFGDARIRLVDRRALPQAVRAASRTQLLEALAEILFLRRALANAADPTRHGATMVLTRFGSARTGTWADCQLIRQLATAYGTGRGVVESWQVRHADYPPLDGEAKDLERQLSNRLVEEVAIRLSGLCLYDYFEGESGLHVWQSLGRLPQLVQVRVLTADAKAPGIVLDERARAREAFKKARAQGRTEVADPDAPLPTVRVYRFEPAVGRDAATPLEVEDFELGWATATRGKSPVDALPELWRLRMSREDEAGG